MNQFRYSCFKKTHSIDDVLLQLQNLDEELKDTDMSALIAFNHTYLIITNDVYNKLGTHFFTNDDLMNTIDTCFGNYYFTSLQSYINGKHCPPAWKITFDSCKHNTSYGFIYMALGVNAHVNNDLPQSLFETMNNADNEDYEKINSVINESIPMVIKDLYETNTFIYRAEQVCLPLYHVLLQMIIKNWRSEAWKNYQKLDKKATDTIDIEFAAEKKAQALASFKNWRALLQVFGYQVP